MVSRPDAAPVDAVTELAPDAPDRPLVITAEHESAVVRVRGHLDEASSGALERALNRLIEHRGRPVLVVDVLDMSVDDDASLAVFRHALARARSRGGALTLTAPSAPVYERLEHVGLGEVVFQPQSRNRG